MIVSWNWLKTLVDLDMPPEELERRLMMAGLNHESSSRVGDDLAIDLEVTSNRPDCLGHIGIGGMGGYHLDRMLEFMGQGQTSVAAVCDVTCLPRIHVDRASNATPSRNSGSTLARHGSNETASASLLARSGIAKSFVFSSSNCSRL